MLTTCVCKETYERLGLVGLKLPFKHQSGERYVISLPLHKNADSVPVQARRRSALESWDADFGMNVTAAGAKITGGQSSQRPVGGVWEVAFCSTAPINDNKTDELEKWVTQVPIVAPVTVQITCEKSHLKNIWIPNPALLPPRPQLREEDEFKEDWQHDVDALLEWVGMAGFHAQRLYANDRVDPFVAIYEPPAASQVGNVTHLRWKGLISPAFVQAVIDASITFLRSTQLLPESFVAITMHGVTNSPVVYLPQARAEKAKHKSTAIALNPPAHLPRKDGEDTWSLVLAPGGEGKDLKSILYESVGQWDARWG
ncbi:hypothetical protein NP233_g7871 [Leucocoprinus birnbaumii]|uniref:Uncharacterized protein n=1 Tax=Leucocoprinus birnbaumii TaxID=56174 RepID=A0AAD5YNL2_9AGAR|nr:hypothetical protein NP233_g7871 [Leucocoprinus birnbaumii]